MAMEQQRIIMNFAAAPSADDIDTIAKSVLANLPDEMIDCCDSLAVQIEDFPDEAIQAEMELADPYELVALYRSGKEIAPGVQRKIANDDDVLLLFRRPILDLWCDIGEDLTGLIREVIIQEIGNNFEFSEDEIDDMASRHHQGMF